MTEIDITVPPTPAGLHRAACWRKTVTALDTDRKGGFAVEGEFLHAATVVKLTAGTLIVAVDKATTGWTQDYYTGKHVALEDATVTALLADPQAPDGLRELWSRHYKTAKSAFGATTIRKLTALLVEYPAPNGPVTLVTDARRRNTKAGACRWCKEHLPADYGHIAYDDHTLIEHWQKCSFRPAANGDTCALCGVTVATEQAQVVMVREGTGRWETQHRSRWGNRDCRVDPYPSFEEQRAERRAAAEAEAKEKARKEKEAAKREARKAERDAAEEAAHLAEQDRVARLAVVATETDELYSKALGESRRATLTENLHTLEDGTTTTDWTLTIESTDSGWNGEDYDPEPGTETRYTRLAEARSAYQGKRYTPPAPRRTFRAPRAAEPATCPTPNVTHCGNCGTTQAIGGWMSASLGTSCPECYDDMADGHGDHDLRYHMND